MPTTVVVLVRVGANLLLWIFFGVSLFSHAMVGVLSQNIPMLQCLRFGMTDYNTSHTKSSPVSSTYDFFLSLFLLFSNTKRLWTSSGNRIYHTIGGKSCVPLVHTYPTPSSDASVNPMYCGSPRTSSYTIVGIWKMLLSRVSQYYNMRASSESGQMLIVIEFFYGALLSVWNSPFMDGIPIALCHSHLTSFEISSGIGTWYVRLILFTFLYFAPCMWGGIFIMVYR